jgi:hypothetical protein
VDKRGRGKAMSERWIQILETILKQITQLEHAKDQDRLDLVQSIRFLLTTLHNGVRGWIQWVNNPKIMTQFTQDDLENIATKLTDFTRAFIEYDIAATRLGTTKGLKRRKTVQKKQEEPFLV